MKDFEIGELVIDHGSEVVEYLGYEEDEEDHYHVLLSLKQGQYRTSAVYGPSKIKGSEGYEEILRLWYLNKERALQGLDEDYKLMKEFCSDIKVPEGIAIFSTVEGSVYIHDKKNSSNKYYQQKYLDIINVDIHQIKVSKEYRILMSNFILSKIK